MFVVVGLFVVYVYVDVVVCWKVLLEVGEEVIVVVGGG